MEDYRLYAALFLCLIHGAWTQETYTAAVVEYVPTHNPSAVPFVNIKKQAENYVEFIKKASAQNVQIIIFPEAGITSLETMSKVAQHLKTYCVPIPEEENFNPCLSKDVHVVLKNLSCAAAAQSMYVVVNLLEISDQSENFSIYNTDLVFNNKGVIIAKYRKINLFNEAHITPGNKTVTFTTSFGVTFGLMTCFDLMFEKPAIDLIKNENVTDVIFTAAWGSSLPFLQALSIQSGYATAYGVNVLAANLYDEQEKSSGSGIYLANGTSYVYVSNKSASKLIVRNVLKQSRRRPSECAKYISNKRQYVIGPSAKITEHNFVYENLTAYSHKEIGKMGESAVREEVCNGKFCCKLEIKGMTSKSSIVYKLIAFDGVIKVALSNKSVGKRTCGLVACEASSDKSCGRNVDVSDVKFDSILLTGVFDKDESSSYIPITLTSNYVPLDNYHFCVHDSDKEGKTTFTIIVNSTTTGINTFGIYGRVYSSDGKDSSSGFVMVPNIIAIWICIIFHMSLYTYIRSQ